MKRVMGVALLFLAACSSTSHVMVGTQRPAISPDQVHVYTQAPAAFEQVAMLEASSQGSGAFTAQQKTDKVLSRLKDEAAALGANGILLQGIGSASGGTVNTLTGNSYGNGFSAIGVGVPVVIKQGSAMAIYVAP